MKKAAMVKKLMVLMIALMFLVSACTSGKGTKDATKDPAAPTAEGTESLKPVELTWRYPVREIPTDLQTVEDAVNKITQAKINATIKFKPIVFGDYEQKMNTIVASGEKTDIIWTSGWSFNYAQNQGKGVFIPLDELIDQYAPALKQSMPSFVLNGTRIDGKIYAVPNYQSVTFKEGFIIQKRFADKYNLDINSIKKFEDIEPFLAEIKKGEPDIVPYGMDYRGDFIDMQNSIGIEQFNNFLSINLNDPIKVTNMFESPAYQTYLDTIRQFYTKDYINKDAATLKNFQEKVKTGKLAVIYHSTLKPGSELAQKNQNGGNDVVFVPITPPYSLTSSIVTTMQAISRTSDNPERAMMFINLLNTDKELHNLLSFGIKGKHYAKVSDNVIKVNREAGYAPNADWVFGDIFNSYLEEGQAPDSLALIKKDNEIAEPSPILGFSFSTADVTAEIANLTTVLDQYGPGLNTGTIDSKSKKDEFIDKLKKAGIDKVVAEAQRQLDAWRSENGK